MAVIVSRIIGGIGNQLFSYAAARRLALMTDSELVIDDTSGFVHDLKYARNYQLDHFNIPCRKASSIERLEPFYRIRRYCKRAYNRRRLFANRSYIKQEYVDFDPRLLSVKPHGRVYVEGYWQSEKYFIDVEKTIRKDLRITPPSDATNTILANKIRNNPSVAIHFRFFDAPDSSGANNTPRSYYSRAVKQMEKIAPNTHYFVFSDKPDAAHTCITLPENQVTYVSHNKGDKNAYADLWLMSLCDNYIIANSSFSWWAAWLAQNKNKKVIAPGFEKREGVSWWGFDGLLPEDWIKL